MRRALHAEWTKLVGVPGQLWTWAAVAALMTGVGALAAAAQRPPSCRRFEPCSLPDTTAITLSGVYVAQLAAVMLAVAVVSSEYHPRLIVLTLAARPQRGAVLVAKAAVVGVAVLAGGAAGVAGALLAGRGVLAARGFGGSDGPAALTDPALLRAAAGTWLYLVLVAALAFGAAWLLRHRAAAAGGVTALLYGPYLLAVTVPMPGRALHAIRDVSPMTAGLAVQSATRSGASAPLAPWAGVGVLAAYAAVFTAAGWFALRVRDA